MAGFGVVLGAGGGTGRAFHAGVLAALDDVLGIDARDARVIVGTSAGAVDAAFLRAGVSPGDLFLRVTEQDCSPAAAALFASLPEWTVPDEDGPPVRWRPASPARLAALARRPWAARPRSFGTVLAAMMRRGRRSTDVLERSIAALHPGAWPDAALWLCTVRLDDGSRVVFGRDTDVPPMSVARAVAASCAVASYFEPVVIGGQPYVDGGMYSPSNADLLAGQDLDFVVISSAQSMSPRARHASPDTWLRASCRMLLRPEAARVERSGCPVLLIEPSALDVAVMGTIADSMNMKRMSDVALRAYRSTAERITTGPLSRVAERVAWRRRDLTRSAS
jgi:NTE family protein